MVAETSQTNIEQRMSTVSFADAPESSDVENQGAKQSNNITLKDDSKGVSEFSTLPALDDQKLHKATDAKTSTGLPTTVFMNYKATKAPKETLQAVYKTGEYKAALPLNLLMVQSFMAGIYIAMAGHLYLSVSLVIACGP